MGGTVDPMASTIVENGESKDVLPENAGTKPIPSTANLAGLEKGPEPALQIPQASTARAAPPALQMPHPQHCKSRRAVYIRIKPSR